MAIFTRRDFLGQLAAGLTMTLSSGADAASKPRPMLKRTIAASGGEESVPVIGMGTWNTFDVGGSSAERVPLKEVLGAFFESGASVIDSSPMYGRAEAVTGELVEAAGAQDRSFLATKVWTSGVDKGVAQIESSFRRLRTPRLDLLQIHNLVDWHSHVPTLRSLKESGRVRYIGITHYTVNAHADLEAGVESRTIRFRAVQLFDCHTCR
jgi:diketogulonate reductase-like aldo/keto reductase